MMSASKRRDPRGAILVVAVLLLTLLATLGVGLLSASLTESMVALNDVNAQRALNVAEAGIAHARQTISSTLSGTSLTSRLAGATLLDPEVALAGFSNNAGLGAGSGTYSVWVSNNLSAYNKSPGYAADLVPASDTDSLIWIRSVGTYRNATRTVRILADLSSAEVLDPPGTITLVDGSGADGATFNGNAFLITGNDTAAPTSAGACGTLGASKYGISVNSVASYAAVAAAVADNQEDNVTGSGEPGNGSYANNGNITATELQRLATSLLPLATAIPGGPNSNSYGCGAPTEGPPPCSGPGLFKATSDIKLDGSGMGYGVLIVTANFEMAGNYKWEGLIIVVGTGTAAITGADSKIYGSLLVANTQGGTTNLTMQGNGGAYYSSQAICRVKNSNLIPNSIIIAWQQVD